MKSKQELVEELLCQVLKNTKTGVIIKGIENIHPEEIAEHIAEEISPLYVAAIGYGITEKTESDWQIADSIEKAVLWRSMPELAKHILVFIKSDVAKLHSLADFDHISTRDISKFLLNQQINREMSNKPTKDFWCALADASDYYTFDDLYDFVKAVNESSNYSESISQNMWRIGLLSDDGVLESEINSADRLEKNRSLILQIGQLNEESRKNLSISLVKTESDDKSKFQDTYSNLQKFYKYGNRETLRNLDMETVQKLFSASQSRRKKKTSLPVGGGDEPADFSKDGTIIRSGELNGIVDTCVVNGDAKELEDLRDLTHEIEGYYNSEESDNTMTPPMGGIFENRRAVIEKKESSIRKLVCKYCKEDAWGGMVQTDESVLKDAISSDFVCEEIFDPNDAKSLLAYYGGSDGPQDMFGLLKRFDAHFEERNLDVERFTPIIDKINASRKELCRHIEMIIYYPVLLFGSDDKSRGNLIEYVESCDELYRVFCKNEPIMKEISSSGTDYLGKAILALDILYIKTPNEWKGVLLPLHPIYLWRFYKVFSAISGGRDALGDENKKVLESVISDMTNVLNFIIVSDILTDGVDYVLPCSGSIEMLPTFENKTNRYLGCDGIESVEEILKRWIAFAPYSRNEIRICSVDAPDLIVILRQIKSFMDESSCEKIVYDVYYTRGQNGNTELSRLDYSGKDYEIGEYIQKEKISISIKNVQDASQVKECMVLRPVHIAFYFDQMSYTIGYGPDSHNLSLNPFVVTYDYKYDDIVQRGSIYPSSEAESGLMGNHHKLMKAVGLINSGNNPQMITNKDITLTDIASTIEDGLTQWLVVADRDTNNYQPSSVIPIGEKQYDRRMVNVWASDQSRIIKQYSDLLRNYNLYPKESVLVNMLQQFGHIASSGLISIPRQGINSQAVNSERKGLIGTLFAASWYAKMHKDDDVIIASLDDDRARLWLHGREAGNERADLIGLYYESEKNILHVQPIEVKTRDASPDSHIDEEDVRFGEGKRSITGHAPKQIALTIETLRDIFAINEKTTDIFLLARREVLKYQIVTECFRNIHEPSSQKRWYEILKKAFAYDEEKNISIDISGVLVNIRLNESSDGEHYECYYPDSDDCRIGFWKLTSKDIQRDVFGEEGPIEDKPIDFDESDNTEINEDTSINYLDNELDNEYTRQDVFIPNYVEPMEDFQFNKGIIDNSTMKKRSDNNIDAKLDEVVIVSEESGNNVSAVEINQLVKDFIRSCGDYHVVLRECEGRNVVIGPSVIRIPFRLGRGQSLQGLSSHLEDIGREMKRTGIIIQQVSNSDELLLDVPRLNREKVLFSDVVSRLPKVTSPEQLYFPLGRTPNGYDLIEDLGQLPHMLVGGSTGSGKTIFLFAMLASLLMTHPHKEDLQLVLSSSKLEDFIHFEGLPHLYSGGIISDATEATRVIKEVISDESERRGALLASARVANIIEYNKKMDNKLEPIVVVIDEFADLVDQLDTKSQQNDFYKPVQRIAQTGRSRGIHLVICTQRPEAKLVPSTIKAQLNGRVALRVNDGTSSRMIIESTEAQYLQRHGDMIYKNGDVTERAQGYMIDTSELDRIIEDIKKQKK